MGDCMVFPKDWGKFLEDYSFKDKEEIYTNGARLIPTFRVEQMMEHYLQKATEDAVPVVHGRWKEWWCDEYITYFHKCSVCGWDALTEEETAHDEVLSNYCPNCGAKMDLEVE